jgi:broad-specificity NMP kinase
VRDAERVHYSTNQRYLLYQMTTQKGPILVITGTPGTGKSTHAQLLASESPIPLSHINVGDWVKEKGLYEDYDDQWQSYTVDEDKVCLNSIFWTSHPS